MGVYMMIIGIADIKFRGMYVSKESEWKNSLECAIAGFLGLVSSEVSAMVICLITLDRLLVLYFPFKSQLHLKRRSSVTVCGIVWFLGLSIAAAPFWLSLDFYGETSICLPLPVTRHKFSGQFYAFAIFIILNFSLFVLIGMGQICIYCIIRNASKQAGANRRSQELAIARRLFLVVFTDFCCWFPIGLMGLLANYGVPIPGVVNVWAAIFILPLNSAINPFLYTLNTLLEKRRTAQLQQRTRRILGNIQSELPKMESSLAEEVVRVCIRSKIVKKDKMSQWLNIHQDSNISYIESAAESENNKGSVKCSFSE
ncbi:relaxin receptor 2-like [Babylonia areolata]|uniref:relaxin receptor 2-like n=1 Tax=Babylonia areolata TaxID=304850 RepID=UPI003FD3B6C0